MTRPPRPACLPGWPSKTGQENGFAVRNGFAVTEITHTQADGASTAIVERAGVLASDANPSGLEAILESREATNRGRSVSRGPR